MLIKGSPQHDHRLCKKRSSCSEGIAQAGSIRLQSMSDVRVCRLEKLHLKLLGFHHPWHPLLTPWETMPTLVELQLAPHHDLERLHIGELTESL